MRAACMLAGLQQGACCGQYIALLLRLALQNQIIAMAVEEVGVNLDDSTRGFSKWKGVDTCENKKWIVRDR